MANRRHLCGNWAQPLTKRAKDGTMLSIQAGMMPAAFPTRCCRSRCQATEAGAFRRDLQRMPEGTRRGRAAPARRF